MALPRPSAPALAVLPALALLPVLITVLAGIHAGGVEIWMAFLSAAVHPSLDPLLLKALLRALQVTLAMALAGWSLSLVLGVLLGCFASERLMQTWRWPTWPAWILRRSLALPRAVHELIWGLLLLQVLGLHPWVAVAAITIPYAALVARVWRDQLDALDPSRLQALLQGGAPPLAACCTALSPAMGTVLMSYGGYRLECALRSATLLGVFGLGGLGTDLQLSLQSLQFRELWSGLWLLGLLSVSLEILLTLWRRQSHKAQAGQRRLCLFLAGVIVAGITGTIWLHGLLPDSGSVVWQGLALPDWGRLMLAAAELPWLRLIYETLLLTVLAAGIAVGLPPLAMLLVPSRPWQVVLNAVWALMRLIPPPLTVLLLLLSNRPTLAIGALALGLHNGGVMGRLLREELEQQSADQQQAMGALGASARLSWLYGLFTPRSPGYLAYGAYRSDVILRETVVVGLIGGSGLGWQLLESLSSFHWDAVLVLIGAYALITLLGEWLNDQCRDRWLQS